MSRVPYSLTAIRSDDDSSGKNIVPYASVSVVDANGNPAQIYFQETGGSPSSSFALNENGFRQIWAEPGRYTITIAGGETYDIFLTGDLSDRVQSVATIADLSALTGVVAGHQFIVNEYNLGTGKGGGEFISLLGAPFIDGGTTIQSSVSGVYFKRINYTTITPEMFGVVFDGTDKTNEFDRFSSAIIAANQPIDRTIIQPGLKSVEFSLISQSNNYSVVITGDSLSFNAFGYSGPYTGIVNGAGYATENPFGLMSWAHMLRDFWFSVGPSFIPLSQCKTTTDCANVSKPTINDVPYVGMNARLGLYEFSNSSQTLDIIHGKTESPMLVVGYESSENASIFYVDGVERDNTSPTGHYLNSGYMLIPCFGNKTTISNVSPKGETAKPLKIYGVKEGQSIPKLTGKGAYTSAQILSEYNSLVGAYTPDIVFYIIGANDTQGGTYFNFQQNVSNFIDRVRADRPFAHIVLLTLPTSSSYVKQVALRYTYTMRYLAETKNVSVIDVYAAFDQLYQEGYRVDNIHFNILGDSLVFDLIKRNIFPTTNLEYSKFTPYRQNFDGLNAASVSDPLPDLRSKYSLLSTISLVDSNTSMKTFSLSYSGSGIDSIVKVVAPVGYKITTADIDSMGSGDASFRIVRKASASPRDVDFAMVDSVGNYVNIINSDILINVNAVRDYGVIA